MDDASPPPPDEELQVPTLPDLKTVFLGGIFLILCLAAIRTTSDILIPVVLACILKLVLMPVQRFLERIHLPRTLAAIVVVLMLVSGVVSFGVGLSGPASEWVEKLSDSLPKLYQRLSFLSDPMESAQKIMEHAENMTEGSGPKVMPVAMQGTRLFDRVFLGTREFFVSLCTMVLVLFFLLVAGDTFLRRVVEFAPRFRNKRQAVDISQQVEHDISVYLLTVTFMNALVGLGTGIAMALCGQQDAVLWGTLAFFLNFVPVLGPMIGVGIFLLVGLLLNNTLGAAVLPAFLYLAIHLAESSIITPLLLAKRFTLNPVLVILSLVFWYWMWGFPGAILAVPMLAITKIICDRIGRLQAFGRFLAG